MVQFLCFLSQQETQHDFTGKRTRLHSLHVWAKHKFTYKGPPQSFFHIFLIIWTPRQSSWDLVSLCCPNLKETLGTLSSFYLIFLYVRCCGLLFSILTSGVRRYCTYESYRFDFFSFFMLENPADYWLLMDRAQVVLSVFQVNQKGSLKKQIHKINRFAAV